MTREDMLKKNAGRMELASGLFPHCKRCGWPTTHVPLCNVCLDMVIAVAAQKGLRMAQELWEMENAELSMKKHMMVDE
jgi:hypothetical protein